MLMKRMCLEVERGGCGKLCGCYMSEIFGGFKLKTCTDCLLGNPETCKNKNVPISGGLCKDCLDKILTKRRKSK